MNLISLLAALPLGDDTPILLFAIIGIVALVLMIASVALGAKGKNKKK